MKRVHRTLAGLALLTAALVLPAAQPDRKSAEANLRALDEQIAMDKRRVQNDAVEKDRLNRAFRDADRSVSRAKGDLSALRAKRAERSAARQQLVTERSRRQSEREATESDLASQLRAAYFMGRSEPLKLLLNQRNPAEFGRNLTYYGYLGRLRASQIHVISENISKIDELTVRIDEEDAELAALESQQKERVGELQAARRKQDLARASLEQESRNRVAALKRKQADRERLEQVLKELIRQAEATPYDPNSPFEKLRKKLSWPVAGRVTTGFGATTDGFRSDGIEIDAEAGAEVRAVHDGVVMYSDWLPGRGLVIILDHGSGYLSLYGHNEQLFKQKETKVKAGETIATAGNSGGRKRPGLHFEIRRAGKPVDPRGWFRTSAPPAG
jgi:septal ring factor EnvC (AmiA/AmiB activator)